MSVTLSHTNRAFFGDASCCDCCRAEFFGWRGGHSGLNDRKKGQRNGLRRLRRTIKRRERIFVQREIAIELAGE